jgi:hypothetical protein
MPRLSAHQRRYIAYVQANPGCSIADVARACKLNPQAGHKWVYDGVGRLLRRGVLVDRSPNTQRGVYALHVVS